MLLEIGVFTNSDDAYIVWRAPAPITDCVGFELVRKRNGKEETVNNRISFGSGDADPSKPESSASSPLRRFSWTDHEVNQGDHVAYQVIPVIRVGHAASVPDKSKASAWTPEVTLSGKAGTGFECYFNRGLVMSQAVTRMLGTKPGGPSTAELKKAVADDESKLHDFLAGNLGTQLEAILDDAAKSNHHVFAALFEISDEALLTRLEKLGRRAHVVLSNGVHGSRTEDENAAQRARLEKAGCEIVDRMLPSKALGHNKFMVVTDASKNPLSAWTGSANWTPTGLCTQTNNAIVMDDDLVARIFLDQWNRLKDAGDGFPPELVHANSIGKHAKVGSAKVTAWFTRTMHGQEIDAVRELIDGAKQGILFLMFEPGSSSLLDAIVARQSPVSPTFDQNLYIHGVISTISADNLDQAKVSLVQRGSFKAQRLEIVQPAGLKDVGKFVDEISRGAFLRPGGVGHAIVHSKVIVIDPKGDHPVVVTGSHNFSKAASSQNDENLVIVENNSALAQAYAVNVKSVYDHYRWRAFAIEMQSEGKDAADFLKDEKAWQASWFRGDHALELAFWFGSAAKAAAGGR